MHLSPRLLAALLAISSLLGPAVLRADDDEKSASNTDKTEEKAPPSEVTTPGSIEARGQRIAYNAVVGTITVGATDTQDAQLGMDGNGPPYRCFGRFVVYTIEDLDLWADEQPAFRSTSDRVSLEGGQKGKAGAVPPGGRGRKASKEAKE